VGCFCIEQRQLPFSEMGVFTDIDP
jgi:hypothetical protein